MLRLPPGSCPQRPQRPPHASPSPVSPYGSPRHMPGTYPTSPRALPSRRHTTPTSLSLGPPIPRTHLYPLHTFLTPRNASLTPAVTSPGQSAHFYCPSEQLPHTSHDYPEHLAPTSQRLEHLPPTCRDPAGHPARLPHPSEHLTRPHYGSSETSGTLAPNLRTPLSCLLGHPRSPGTLPDP